MLLQDLRHGLHLAARNPGFTVVVVLTLALGVGANTAIFSVLNAVLLHPLPYKDPGRLALLWTVDARPNVDQVGTTSFRDFELWRAQSRTFEDMTIFWQEQSVMTLTGGNEPEKVRGGFVAANFFPMLGVAPHREE